MWLSILWQNKGLIIAAVLLVIFVGLGIAVKVQSSRLSSALSKIGEAEKERDAAIEAHDQLVRDWERQKAVMAEREAARLQQEKDNAKLLKTIKDALQTNRSWADAPMPTSIVQSLSTLPEAGVASKPDKPNNNPGVSRPNQ